MLDTKQPSVLVSTQSIMFTIRKFLRKMAYKVYRTNRNACRLEKRRKRPF